MVAKLISLLRKPQASAHRALRNPRALEPPITSEETGANLTVLEQRLNHGMMCPVGRNQVFLRSLVTPQGVTRPRTTLKCHLRRDIGLRPDVFYEHIRDVCCSNPDACEAYRRFKDRFVQT